MIGRYLQHKNYEHDSLEKFMSKHPQEVNEKRGNVEQQ